VKRHPAQPDPQCAVLLSALSWTSKCDGSACRVSRRVSKMVDANLQLAIPGVAARTAVALTRAKHTL
jgi:hypothetical protein